MAVALPIRIKFMAAAIAHVAYYNRTRSRHFTHKLQDTTKVVANITLNRSALAHQCSQTIQITAAWASSSTITTLIIK